MQYRDHGGRGKEKHRGERENLNAETRRRGDGLAVGGIRLRFSVEAPSTGLEWRDYKAFKPAIDEIVKMENEGNPELLALAEAVEKLGYGLSSNWEDSIGVFNLTQNDDWFIFAIREVKL